MFLEHLISRLLRFEFADVLNICTEQHINASREMIVEIVHESASVNAVVRIIQYYAQLSIPYIHSLHNSPPPLLFSSRFPCSPTSSQAAALATAVSVSIGLACSWLSCALKILVDNVV